MAKRAQTQTPERIGPVVQALEQYQQRLSAALEDSRPPTKEEVQTELAAATRVAALTGDLPTAIKGYDALGKQLGMGLEQSNHLHIDAGLLALSESELAAQIQGLKRLPALQQTEESDPITQELLQ